MIVSLILGVSVLLLLAVNVILASALVRRMRPATGQGRALPVVMLGSTIQALVAVAPAAEVRRAIDYWWDHRELVDVMARQFVEQQATRAGQIIDDSGQDVKSFIDSLPRSVSARPDPNFPAAFPTVDMHG